MNNYQTPYFSTPMYSNYSYSPYSNMNNTTQQIQQPSQYTQATQPIVSTGNFDFVGNYVKSYEEVKNSPYTDKTVVYIDRDNDKLYIKKINEKGIPETSVFLVTLPQETTKNIEEKDDNSFMNTIEELKKDYNEKIEALKNQIKELKSTKGGK